MPLEPHRERADAAEREINVVGADTETVLSDEILQVSDPFLVGRDAPDRNIGVAAEIFRAGVDGEVDAGIERAEVERGRPGIVHQHGRAFGVRGRSNRRDVLHFETERSRRLDENGAGVFAHQAGDRGRRAGGRNRWWSRRSG